MAIALFSAWQLRWNGTVPCASIGRKGGGAPRSLIDKARSPELFVDGTAGFLVRNDVVTSALSSTRADHGTPDAELQHVVVPV